MSDTVRRTCPVCGQGELEPYRSCCLVVQDTPLSPAKSFIDTEMYVCPHCRYLALFAPMTPAELFQQEQNTLSAIADPVQQFEYRFRDYSDRQLQKVIDGRDYVPDAKKAAKELLRRRKYES